MNEWRRKGTVVDVDIIAGFKEARSKAEEDVSISVNFGGPRVGSNRYVIISSHQGIKRIGLMPVFWDPVPFWVME